MTRRILLFSLSCGFLVGLAASTPAHGQSLFDGFGARLRGEEPPDEVPAPAPESAPAPASSYIGLVGDDRGTDGRGVRVLTVRPGGPAEKAGLQAGDLITGMGNQAVRSIADMAEIVSRTRPGEGLEIAVERGASRTAITVVPTLRPPPDSSAGPTAPATEPLPPPRPLLPPRVEPPREVPEDPPLEAPAADDGRPYLGIRVSPLDPTTRRELPLLVRRGVVIRTVDPGSPADRASLPVGGVVVAVDGRRIATSEDLVAAISGMRAGQEMEVMYYQGRTASRRRVVLASQPSESTPGPAAREPEMPLLVPPAREGDRAFPDREPPIGGLPGGRILPDGDLPPAVREVERVIGDILRPRDAGGGAVAGGAAADGDVAALRAEVTALRDQVQQLQLRLAELERLLAEPARPDGE